MQSKLNSMSFAIDIKNEQIPIPPDMKNTAVMHIHKNNMYCRIHANKYPVGLFVSKGNLKF